MNQLQADFAYCEAIIKKYSTSFYYAFSQLPQEKASAVYAIYAFCRTADDIVDSHTPHVDKRAELNRMKEELDLFAREEEVSHPLWRALRHVFTSYPKLEVQPFYDQLTGQFMDLNFSSPATLDELERYSYYVAGSVGLMLLPIIASGATADLHDVAIELGIAMQLTNILRDIGEDWHTKQRIYLPTEELLRYGYTRDNLLAGIIDTSFIELWENIASRAEALYEGFYNHIELFDQDSRLPLQLSARLYSGILDAVRSNDYDCLSKRSYVTKTRMTQIHSAISHYS